MGLEAAWEAKAEEKLLKEDELEKERDWQYREDA